MDVTGIGVIGCGNISGIYLKNAHKLRNLRPVACADLAAERARAQAEAHDVPRACSVEELLADEAVEIVVNLTPPAAHADVGMAVLESGKSLHNEKPLATTREAGRALLEAASARDLRVGCAPDTFMGGGHQTCRKLVDAGAIGEPVGATAFVMGGGHESWHPDPAFYYQPGGGPMFDMGPYYLTALVNLLGPIRRVTGMTRAALDERVVGTGPKAGTTIPVEVPTHVIGVMEFASGPMASLVASFDVPGGHNLPRIEVYGTEGTLSVPDPNGFGGPVRLKRAGDQEWEKVEIAHPYTSNSRGVGVADMAAAMASGRPHRASGRLAQHVLDAMVGFHDAGRDGRHGDLESTCDRPAPIPEDLAEWSIDA